MKKRNITQDKICHAAIELIEKNGLEQLSMRKLAGKLNIEAASLYNHIKDKSQLFDLIQEYLYSQMRINLNEQNWKEHLIELASATREGLLKFPNTVLLFATRPTVSTSSLDQVEKTLKVLIKAGFKYSDIIILYRNLHVFVLGHVLAEVGRVPGALESEEPSLAKINIDNYPALKRSYSYKTNIDFNRGFKMGLESIIKGFEYLLRQSK